MMAKSQKFERVVTKLVALLGLPLLMVASVSAQGNVLIVQTNSAGDNVHIIDPDTNTVVGEISGIERAHGAAPTPDGRFLYVAGQQSGRLAAYRVDPDDGTLLPLETYEVGNNPMWVLTTTLG